MTKTVLIGEKAFIRASEANGQILYMVAYCGDVYRKYHGDAKSAVRDLLDRERRNHDYHE